MKLENNLVQRKFIVGDKWIYYKIYCGAKTSDYMLTEVIKPIIKNLIENNIISKWFFIRYSDPSHHIRVRLYLNDSENIGRIINIFTQNVKIFVEEELIHKIEIDTYNREIERYGSRTIELSEKIFFHESNMVVNFLSLHPNDELRFLFALKSIDTHLNGCHYSLEEKAILFNQLKISFRNEFDKKNILTKDLSNKFRFLRNNIESFLDEDVKHQELKKILDEKNKNVESLLLNILKLRKSNNLEIHIDNLNSSYIHMLMNRMFKSKNRIYEMIGYDFLSRYYESKIAKAKYSNK
ncbi:MAG: hypothetical protein GW849_02340 [Flavobacteriia bacterium]|nr:hypothetical protein [Flavobacteriia bacterium]NCT18027.1 hypothetical protein [Flavobacteriia bacterium]